MHVHLATSGCATKVLSKQPYAARHWYAYLWGSRVIVVQQMLATLSRALAQINSATGERSPMKATAAIQKKIANARAKST